MTEEKKKKKWIPLALRDDWADIFNVSKDIKKIGIKVEIVGGCSLIFRADGYEEVGKKLKKLYGGGHHFAFFLPTEKKIARSICFREEIKKCKKDLLYSIYDSVRTLRDKI